MIYRIYQINQRTDKVKRSDRKISVEQLNCNLYKLMKWRASLSSDTGFGFSNPRKVNKPCINNSEGHVDEELVPLEISLDCDQPFNF